MHNLNHQMLMTTMLHSILFHQFDHADLCHLPEAPKNIDLPNYPPREATDLRIVDDLAYVA